METTKKQRDFKTLTYEDDKGYLRYKDSDRLVHRGVAYHKIYLKDREKYPDKFSNYSIHHINGKKQDNRVENLQIVTRKEHKKSHGIRRENAMLNWIGKHPVLTAIIFLLIIALVLFIAYQGGFFVSAECKTDIYDCGDFNSCSEVKEVFNKCKNDIHYLDGDGDKIPCESLCG